MRDAFVDTDRGVRDLGPGGADGGGGVGGEADVGVGGEDGGGGAGGGIRMLEDCEDICGVYTECGSNRFPGGQAECLDRCADAQLSERFVDYLTCMQITRCDQLDRCTIPERPLPPCADVCTALAACDPAPRLPAGLPGVADCASACADPTLGRLVARCGLGAVDGACDAAGFDACVLEERGGACLLECTTRAGCDPEVDLTTCTLECLSSVPPEDPVAARRVSQVRTCVRNSADCEEVAACEARSERPIVGERTVEDLCAANASCGFLSMETCPEDAEALLRRLADGAVDCFTDHLTNQCGEAPYACLQPAPAPEGACEEHCLVSQLCGLLPEGQTEFECLERCQAALATGDPLAIDPYLPYFACAFGPDCPAILECQSDATPDDACRAACIAQIDCNAEGSRTCRDDCAERFSTSRQKAERACIDAADGCENVRLCIAPEPPDCASLCEPLQACGLAELRCPIECDDAHFAAPEAHLPLTACVNGHARCGGREDCLDGELAQGEVCLAWCKARVTCNPQEEQTLEACVLECARGEVTGQRGLVLGASEACLGEAGPDAACDVLQRCITGAEFSDYCVGYCAELNRCRLEDDVAACEATCRAANPDVDAAVAASCVLNSRRRRDTCEATATCINAELPEISGPCRDRCDALARCDDRIDAFLCALDCDPDAAGLAVVAACSKYAACEDLNRCSMAPAAIPRGCPAACGVISACPGLVGAGGAFDSFDDCTAECAGVTVLQGAAFPDRLQTCAEDAECDGAAIAECFAVPEDFCAAGQAAVTACGLDQSSIPGFPPLVPDYLADCQALRAQDPVAAAEQVQCLIAAEQAAAGDPLACFFNAIGCGVGGI